MVTSQHCEKVSFVNGPAGHYVLGAFFSLWAVLTLSTLGMAQDPSPKKPAETERARSFRDRVTDRASLKDGTQLFGMAVSEKPAQLVVRTAWVEQQLPEFYQNELKPLIMRLTDEEPSALMLRLDQEIEDSRKNVPDDRRRSGLLKEIRDRIVPDPAEVSEHVVVEIAKVRLRNMELQKEPRRELCRLAILNDLVNYEDMHWKSVTEKLQAIPEASRQTIPSAEAGNADDDLYKILAAVDVQLASATKLIQSGDQVIDESQKPDLSVILSSMMGGNVQSLLNDLLNEGAKAPPQATVSDELPSSARAMAERNQQKTIVLSSFEFDLNTGSATVSKRLFRQMDDMKWMMVLATASRSTVNDIKPGQAEAIANDPQIKEISGLVNGLGIGGEKLDTALKMGAVVQNAMNSAENEFAASVQRFINTKGLTRASKMPKVVLE